MKIYDKNNVELIDIEVDDNSFRYRSVMKGDSVTLYYALAEHVEIPAGSYILMPGGQRYTLFRPENFSKKGSRHFEYTVVFESDQELLKRYKYKFINPTADGNRKSFDLKFPMTAKPARFLQLLIDNLNLYNPPETDDRLVWKAGACIEATEKPLSFNHDYCYDVLARLAGEFNTEWEIEGRTVHLCKTERFKDNPTALSYGKGNGFKTGVGRQTQSDKPPVTRLYVQGGERNIDVSGYGSKTLLLPGGRQLTHEGRIYQADPDGTFIRRADKVADGVNEDSFDASHIYPGRTGTVSEVIAFDAGRHIYHFTDTGIPEGLDYTACRLPGEKATVVFQSGLLTGREFEIEQANDEEITGYIHAERKFKLLPLQADGATLPNDVLYIRPGDTYAVFNISLPPAYIRDDASQTGASWDLFREAARYLYEHEEERFRFTGELDGIWAKKRWLEIGGKLVPGGYIRFSDTQFQPEGVLIRITGVKDYINNPHSPELELSNIPVGGFVSGDLNRIEAEEVANDARIKNERLFTVRRFRDAVASADMLQTALLGTFSESINPVTVRTLSLLAGDESLQFRFVDGRTNPAEVAPAFHYDQTAKVFTVPGSLMQHMTLGIDKMSTSHKVSEYRFWDIEAYTSPSLDEPAAMFLYTKVGKSGTAGSFLLSKTAYKQDPGDGDYYYLTGILSSELEGKRSFATVYGYTEILPGRITVPLIVSPDGNTYFNIQTGEIGGKIVFKPGSTGYQNIADRPNLTPLYNGLDDALSAAGDKAKVFYAMNPPSSGMKTNDLWVNGQDIYRWSGSEWKRASTYDVTETVINGGLITTGAISFGKTGGMAASGEVRIWSGGTSGLHGQPPDKPTFRVFSDGSVNAKNSIKVEDANGDVACGFSSTGTNWGGSNDPGSVRIWAGACNPKDAPFRVTMRGDVYTPSVNLGDNAALRQSSLHLPSDGQITMYSKDGRSFKAVTSSPLLHSLLELQDIGESASPFTTRPILTLLSGRSAYSNVPRTWINCGHAEKYGWGSRFVVESRYLSDPNQMERTCINVGPLMTGPQLASMLQQSSVDGVPVYWDRKSNFLYLKI